MRTSSCRRADIKIGTVDYNLFTNNQFQLVKPMEDIVVRKVGDVPVRVRDLGYVSDSHEAQSSVVSASTASGPSTCG